MQTGTQTRLAHPNPEKRKAPNLRIFSYLSRHQTPPGFSDLCLFGCCCCSVAKLCLTVTPRTGAHQASLSFTISGSLLKLVSIESVKPSYHLVLCCPLLLLPAIFPSVRVFSNESVLHIRWPKCWSVSFSISPSNEYSGLISFRMDWLDLLAVQGTLKRLLPHHNLKASILWCSAFFMVQLSHPYMTTGKTVALTIRTFVGKVMFLLFNMLSSFVRLFGVSIPQFCGFENGVPPRTPLGGLHRRWNS